jgi:hypothetical protein
MNHLDFEALCDALLGDARKNIMAKKGREYAGNEDRLANFKRGAANCGVNPETVLYVYLSKHIDSLSTFIRDLERTKNLKSVEEKLTEPIAERLKDAINYLLLLHGLIKERSTAEKADTYPDKVVERPPV